MDDLADVWGPQGRATLDPSSVRTGPAPRDSVEAVQAPPAPSPARRSTTASANSSLAPTSVRVPWPVAFGVVVVAGAIVAMVLVGADRGGRARPLQATAAGSSTATTIVSAAADLLGRSTSTTAAGDQPPATTTPTTTASTETTMTTVVARGSTSSPSATSTSAAMAEAQRGAERFIAVLQARDCDGLWSLLSASTRRLLGDDADSRSRLCEDVKGEEIPPMSVRGPARPNGEGGAHVLLESQGEVETLTLVLEDGRWVVDLLASVDDDSEPATGDVDAGSVKRSLHDAATAEAALFEDTGRFSDDTSLLRELEPALVWRTGVAPPSAVPGEVHVAIADGGRVVCVSTKADNGARFMLKRVADGTTTTAGGEIPTACDASPLGGGW